MKSVNAFPMRPAASVDWDSVTERYADLVFSIPLKCGLSRHDASEVFQNTWLVALAKDEAPEEAGMAPWLASIASWQTRHLRRSRRTDALAETAAAALEDDRQTPVDVLAESEEEQAVRDALAALGPRDRALLQSLYLAETPLSYAETARRLGVAAGSLATLRQRAMKRMRKALTPFAPV
jgi:RNA polymerase sigma factor (sigma-70 family)